MGNIEAKRVVSVKRKRNFIAKRMLETDTFKKKIHIPAKEREKQRKWRMKDDPEGDYEQLDDWLVHTEDF